MNVSGALRRPGRPRAIPEDLTPVVIFLYQSGLGYRAIARELREQYISVDWSTVRRVIKAQLRKTNQNSFSRRILPLFCHYIDQETCLNPQPLPLKWKEEDETTS